MKKGKLLLAGTALLASLLFTSGVKADGPSTIWQTYENGSTIIYDNVNYRRCPITTETCKEYTVSGDDGIEDEYVTLTNSEGSMEINKYSLSGGYILVSGSEQGESYLYGETEIGDGDPTEGVTDFMYIEFFDQYADADDIIYMANSATVYPVPPYEGAHKYVTLYSWSGIYISGNTEIEEGVSVYAPAFGNRDYNIINNGKLKVGAIYANKITGNGSIKVVYSANAEMGDPYFVFDRISIKEITGNTLDVTGATIKEGLQVGTPGEFGEVSKADAQKMIDMLNAAKGNTLKGYKIVLKEYEDDFFTEGKAYYGELVKDTTATAKSNSVVNKLKAAVKNPKTADTLFTILGTLALAGGVLVVTVKKAKQN